MLEHLDHHFLKLLVINLSVPISVDLLDDLFPDVVTQILVSSQNLFNLIHANGSTLVFVKVIKCLLQLFILQETLSVRSCCQKL